MFAKRLHDYNLFCNKFTKYIRIDTFFFILFKKVHYKVVTYHF